MMLDVVVFQLTCQQLVVMGNYYRFAERKKCTINGVWLDCDQSFDDYPKPLQLQL